MNYAWIRTASHREVLLPTRVVAARHLFADIYRRLARVMHPGRTLLFIGVIALCSMAAAQTAHFTGYESVLPVSGTVQPAPMAIAVDATGNVYISDFANNQVVKLTPTATGYTQTTVASGLVSPRGVTVDASGSVYIADFGGHQLYKVPWSGSAYSSPVPLLSGSYSPADVAVDPFGYAFFTNWGDPNVYAVAITSGPSAPFAMTQFAGMLQPLGIAWESTGALTGNLLVTDYSLNNALESSWNGVVWGAPVALPTSGLVTPTRIAVGGDGSAVIADLGNNRIVKIPWTGSAWGIQATVQSSSLNSPQGVAADGNGNVYVADFGNQRAIKETFGAAILGNVPVASTRQAIPLFFTFDTAGVLGSTATLTQGIAGLDFADTHSGTCTSGHTYSAGDNCTISVTLRPRFAGPSYGASVLKDGAGNVIATGFLYGTGSGPQVNFLPGAESIVPVSGSSSPQPIVNAVDASGNIYISDYVNNQVVKETNTGGGYTQTVVTGGLVSPRGVAVDGGGNVYVADFGGQQLYKVRWNGSVYAAKQPLLAPGVYSPAGLTVDGSGDIFFTNWGSSNVYEISPGGSPTVLPQFSALSQPLGIALDATGNLFVSDYTGNKVVELQWAGAAWGALSTVVATGLSNPSRIAIDGAENIYIADSGNNRVAKAPWDGTEWSTLVTLQTSTLNSPQGVALDGSGNLYIVDFGNSRVLKEDYADPPSLNFQDTVVTLTSTDSAQTVAAVNIGNQNLLFNGSGSDPAYPADFPENNGDAHLCVSGTPLLPGATCDLSVNFIPTVAGNLSESLVLTDNHLNAPGPAYTTQSILLRGTGLPQPTVLVAPSSVPFSDQVQGTTANAWTLTLNNTSNISVLNILMSIVGANPSNFTIQGTTCGSTLAPYSTCIIQVAFTPTVTGNSSDYYSATLRIDDDAIGHPQTVPLSGTGTAMTALLSPNYVNFGTQTVGGTSAGQTVILTNASSGTLTVNNISVSETDGNPLAFAITSSTCGAVPIPPNPPVTLGPNANCTITMTFTPSGATSYSGRLTVTDNGLGGTQTVVLSGTGAGQNVFLSPTSIAFGNQTVGSTSNAWTVTYNNTSNLPVTGISVSTGGSNPGDFSQTNTCGATLAAYSTCNIMVAFTPQSAAYFTGTLVVTGSAGTQTASLSGTGTAATAALAPNQLNFGSVKQGSSSSTQVATLTNTSGGPLTISSVLISSGSANFSISANTCVSPLAAYATCAISVVFTPQGVSSYTGTLTVTNSGANSPLTTSLVGTGTSNAPSAFFSPASINFGSQTVGSIGNAWGVTLNNTGSVAMTGLTVTTSNANFTISSNTCGTSLAANSVCNLQLEFTPTVLGNLSGSLSASYSGGSLTALLSGVGIAPTVSLAPNSFNFGNQTQGTTSLAQIATLTNTSAGPVSISGVSIGGNASDFTLVNNCSTTLAAYASCTISVAFAPQGAGSFIGTLYVFDTAGSGQQSVTLTGTGTSNIPSGYFSPASINFGNQTLLSASNAWGMTLNNSGAVTMQNISISATGDFSIRPGSNSCTGSLAAGSPCSFQVIFTPTATGARSGTVTALFNNGSITANLTGTGIAPTVSVAPSSLNFGNVIYGNQSSDQAVTVANTSAGTVSNISFTTGGGPFFVDTGAANCGTTLPAYATCTISVYFKPSVLNTASGTLTITDNAAGGLQTVSLGGVGLAASQTITFAPLPAQVAYGAAPISLSATATSGLAVTFSVVSGPATVSGSTLSFTGIGTVIVAANQAGNAVYAAAPQVTQTIVVNRGAQTITFTPPPSPVNYGVLPITLSATGGASGNPVVFSVLSGPGTVLGSTLTITGAGTVIVAANQAGNTNYAAAIQVTQSIVVNPISQTINFTQPPSPVTYGVMPITLSATGGASGNPVVFSVLSGPGSVLGSTLTITGAGTVIVAANQAGNANYAAATQVSKTIIVDPISQTITFTGLPATAVYGAAGPYTLNGTASSGLPVTYSLISGPGSVVGASLTIIGAGSITVAANQPGNANYAAAAQVTQTIVVSQAVQTITFPQPATPVVLGTGPATLTATSTSGLPISYVVTSGSATVVGATLTYTGAGTVVVEADQPGNANYTAAAPVSRTITVTSSSYTAPTEPVGTTSAPQTATILLPASFRLGSIGVLTQGAANLDFNLAAGGTCTVGAVYTAGDTCTVNYTFKPTEPGARMGAILLYDNTTPLLEQTTFLSGTGIGPQVQFYPGSESTIGSGSIGASGVALDGSGNVYIVDDVSNVVYKEKLSSGSYTESTLTTSALSGPIGIAMDAAGNIYIADEGNHRLLKETPQGSGYSESTVVSGGSYDPWAVAVDSIGNIYIADEANGRVLKETPQGTGYSESTVVNPASSGAPYDPWGVAVDSLGNVYIADYNGNRVLKETLSAGVYSESTIGSGLNGPGGIVVDSVGNVFVAESNGNHVWKETLSAGSYTQSLVATSSLLEPVGVAVDGAGNLYIADYNNMRTLKENYADAPSLSFTSTPVGSTSGDSPQTVTLANSGNATLAFSVPPSGTNPSLATPDFTLNSSGGAACPLVIAGSSSPGQLAAGASCTLPIGFAPTTAGSLVSSLTLTDNSLNLLNTTQAISLTGSATQGAQTITFTGLPANAIYGAAGPYTLNGTASSGLPVAFSLVSGPGSVAGSTLTITGAGTVVVAANQPGNANYAAAAQVTQTILIGPATPSTVLNCAPNPITYQTGATQTATCTATVAGGATGTVTFYWKPQGASSNNLWGMQTLSGGSASMTGFNGLSAGTYTLEADYAGDGNNNATTAFATEVISQATPQVSQWPTASSILAGQALGDSLLSYTTSSGPPVTSVPGTFAWTNPGTIEGATGTPAESMTFTPADSTDYASVASFVQVTVNTVGSPVIDASNFTVAANQTALTLQAGQHTTAALAFIPSKGFKGTVALSCVNLPSGIGCNFVPSSLTSDGLGTVQTSKLTITTVGITQSAIRPQNAPSGTALAGLLLFPGLLMGGILAWRRRRLSAWTKQLLVAGLLAFTLAGFSGCGGAFFRNTLSGMHQITIQAKATTDAGVTTTQTGVLTLTITP